MGDLTTFETIIIAIVEGLTEFLPVSSTGHMIITQNILGVESTEFVKAFTVIIQFGAILSVVCLYWKRFFRLNHTPAPAGASALKCFLHKFDFYWKLLVAFIPAAILGFLFSDKIDEMLESVAIASPRRPATIPMCSTSPPITPPPPTLKLSPMSCCTLNFSNEYFRIHRLKRTVFRSCRKAFRERQIFYPW